MRILPIVLVLLLAACADDAAVEETTTVATGPGVLHLGGPIPTDTPTGWAQASEEMAAIAFFDGNPEAEFEAGWHWTMNLTSCDEVEARTVIFTMELSFPDEVAAPYCDWFVTVEQLAIGTDERSIVTATASGWQIDVQELVVRSRVVFIRDGDRHQVDAETRATADLDVTLTGFTGNASLPFGGLRPTREFTVAGASVERPIGRGNLGRDD